MDKAQMVNVDAAAIMHDGQWLKISDRDEVNDLKNQNSSLQNQVRSLNSHSWYECSITGGSGNVLCYPDKYGGRLLGEVNSKWKATSYITITLPSGYHFTNADNVYSDTNTFAHTLIKGGYTGGNYTELQLWAPEARINTYPPIVKD